MSNLSIYANYKTPPKEACKKFDNGNFKGTDINPMWRIKCLTEEFGPIGIGWYVDIDKQWIEKSTDGITMKAFVNISLYIKYKDEWSKPIKSNGGNVFQYKTSKNYIKVNDECYKMAFTDALGGACKLLGIGADVYWENDKSKYEEKEEPGINENELMSIYLLRMKTKFTEERIKTCLNFYNVESMDELSNEQILKTYNNAIKKGILNV